MLKSYLKIAFRNLWKGKTYAFITIFGLATGIACCILIATSVLQLSFDKFHKNANTIFRLVLSEKESDGGISRNTLFPATLPQALEGWQTGGVKDEKGNWVSMRLIRIDPGYLETLGIPVVAGRIE